MPYNPQTYDRRAEIFQNTSANNVNAAMKVAEWVGGLVDKNKQDAAETASLRKLAAIYNPEGKDKYTAMGLNDLRGEVKGFTLKQVLEEIGQRKAAFEQNQELGAQNLKLAVERLAGEQADRSANARFGDMASGRATTEDDVQAAALANPTAPAARDWFSMLMKSGRGGWNLQPGQTVDFGNGVTGVATTPSSVQPVRGQNAGADTTKPPALFDLGEGRKGYWDTEGTFKTFGGRSQAELPAVVQAQISTLSMSLASASQDATDPGLSNKVRQQRAKDRDRYAAQIDEIQKRFTAAPAAPATTAPAAGGGSLWEQFQQSRAK